MRYYLYEAGSEFVYSDISKLQAECSADGYNELLNVSDEEINRGVIAVIGSYTHNRAVAVYGRRQSQLIWNGETYYRLSD